MDKAKLVTVRVPPPLVSRLKKATARNGNKYPPTITAIMLRGLELALKELERK